MGTELIIPLQDHERKVRIKRKFVFRRGEWKWVNTYGYTFMKTLCFKGTIRIDTLRSKPPLLFYLPEHSLYP